MILDRNGLVRLDSNGALDTTFNASTNAIINAVAIQPAGKILVGGQGYIDRLNTDGTTDATFNTGTGFGGGSRPGSMIYAAELTNSRGGNFNGYNGATGVNRIARLNANGSLDTAFTINTGAGFDFGAVNILALQTDGKIAAGGFFANFNAVSSNNIVRLHANGTRDASFNVGTGFDNVVNDLKLQPSGQIVVGGERHRFAVERENHHRRYFNPSLSACWHRPSFFGSHEFGF